MLDAYKELHPVVYGENAIKYTLHSRRSNCMCFPMHWHDRMELLCVISGQLNLQLSEEQLSLTHGQIAVIEPKTMHYGISGDEGVSYHTIMFEVENFYNATLASDKYLSPLVEPGKRFERLADHPEIFQAAQKLVSIITESKNPLRAAGMVYEIIGLLHEHCSSSSRPAYKFDNKFNIVIEYINQHFAERMSVGEISRKFGYEETYFSRRFRQITGMTALKYITILRLEMAQKLLRNSSADIGEIAWKCGFYDISHFSNCFKKQYGVSPSEFRKL